MRRVSTIDLTPSPPPAICQLALSSHPPHNYWALPHTVTVRMIILIFLLSTLLHGAATSDLMKVINYLLQ